MRTLEIKAIDTETRPVRCRLELRANSQADGAVIAKVSEINNKLLDTPMDQTWLRVEVPVDSTGIWIEVYPVGTRPDGKHLLERSKGRNREVLPDDPPRHIFVIEQPPEGSVAR